MDKTVGVTIGIGRYEELAEGAAALFSAMTGLEVIILNEDLGKEYPYYIKCKIPDYLDSDVENIIYFDADYWMLNKIDVSSLPWDSMVVVCDLFWVKSIQDDAKKLGVSYTRYFNAGFFCLNLRKYGYLFSVVQNLIDKSGVRSKFKDQWAFNLAAEICGVNLFYEDRRMNWLKNGCMWAEKGYPVIATHIAGGEGDPKKDLFSGDILKYVNMEPSVKIVSFDEYAGFYRYVRKGHDVRTLYLREDGIIAYGSARLERYWMPVLIDGEIHLQITGHRFEHRFDSEVVIMDLVEEEKDVWKGKWLYFEEMPVELTRVMEV